MAEFLPSFQLDPNVAWFNVVPRGFGATQKRRGYSSSSWKFQDFIGMFAKRVPHAVSCAFHWFTDSHISLIMFVLTPCSSIAPNILECGTKSKIF